MEDRGWKIEDRKKNHINFANQMNFAKKTKRAVQMCAQLERS